MPSFIDLPPTETQVSKILSIISAYRHRSVNVPDRFAKFVPQVQKQLNDTVSKKEPVRFILPAFPFKAPAEGNKTKALGSLPDKAEEIALQTLDGFADSIAEIYKGGANVVIVSDASVYGGEQSIASLEIYRVANTAVLYRHSTSLGRRRFCLPTGVTKACLLSWSQAPRICTSRYAGRHRFQRRTDARGVLCPGTTNTQSSRWSFCTTS